MNGSRAVGLIVAITIALAWGPASARAQGVSRPELAGRWTLDRDLSQFPAEVGFDVPWVSTGASGSSSGDRRGSAERQPGLASVLQSQDDASRVQQLTAEVSSPPEHLTIIQTADEVTIADDRGHSRTFHPDDRPAVVQLDGVPAGVTARWEAGRLILVFAVERERELRYAYSRSITPPQLVVDAQFVDRGRAREPIRRIYRPTSAAETVEPPPPPTAPTATKPGGDVLPVGQTPAGAPAAPAGSFNQRPDAELKGITRLGLVVEGLTSQASQCGLTQDALESAISKRLADAGFTVRLNSDEDTYLYVNVMTTSLPDGLCVSRHDLSLYTYTTAKLSYQDTPVLVQVELLSKGGIVGGPAAAHGAAVLKALDDYLDQFTTRVRNASR
jgi:hypothetical protein